MNKLFLQQIQIAEPFQLLSREERKLFGEGLPAGSLRRMSSLGVMIYFLLKKMDLSDIQQVVYASRHGETNALEGYMDSFPHPSPVKFQTSIHPSSVQQVFIALQQSVPYFLPLAGAAHSILKALQITLTLQQNPLLILGEEPGSWLVDLDMAYPRGALCMMALSSDVSGAVAELEWSAEETANFSPDLFEWINLLQKRENVQLSAPELGTLSMTWL